MSENFQQQLDMLPDYFGQHVKITVVALAIGIGISLPLAVWLTRRKAARWFTLTAAGVIQTIPGLALLALIVGLLQKTGFWPAVIALILYSMLPILRNTVTGILDVDPSLTDAARGLGMTPGQVLRRVELPLAMPVILAGIRTATVWTVGLATLSTPVGQPSLGNYIFSGLNTKNWTAVLFGCVCAAALAIFLDLLIALIEKGVTKRSRLRIGLATGSLALLVGGGLLAGLRWTDIRVGSKPFTEQYVLAGVLSGLLEDEEYTVEHKQSLGSTMAFDMLRLGQLDAYVDYTGTIWVNYMKRKDHASARDVLDGCTRWLANEHGIRCLGPLGFENAYALAMRRDRSEELSIRSVVDLAGHAPSLSIGSDYEFFHRPEWQKLRDTYGLRFRERRSFNPSIMFSALVNGEVDVITVYTSDGRIAAFDLAILDDPRDAFPPYDAVLLVKSDDPRVIEALLPMIGAIDVATMRKANLMVDREENKRTVPEAAAWLKEQLPR